MIKLPATTKYIRVRHFRVRLSATQIMKFDRNLTVENELHNYALKYLEKTYGRKHLSRPYPSTATEKRYVVKDHILPGFRQEKYGLTKWNAKDNWPSFSGGTRVFSDNDDQFWRVPQNA